MKFDCQWRVSYCTEVSLRNHLLRVLLRQRKKNMIIKASNVAYCSRLSTGEQLPASFNLLTSRHELHITGHLNPRHHRWENIKSRIKSNLYLQLLTRHAIHVMRNTEALTRNH